MSEKVIEYDIMDYIKDDSELQKEVINELLNELQRAKAENKELKEKHKKLTCKILEVSTLNKTLVESCKNCEDIISYRKALEEIKNNCVEILATIAEEGKPNHSIVDTVWCKNIPCCTLFELVEGMQNKINEVLK